MDKSITKKEAMKGLYELLGDGMIPKKRFLYIFGIICVLIDRKKDTENETEKTTSGKASYTTKITVNGRESEIITGVGTVSYDDVIRISDKSPGRVFVERDDVFTITYSKGPVCHQYGCLLPGDKVEITDGMVFTVTKTTRA